jgi:GxxExxY protein
MPELLKNLLQEDDKLLHKELSYKVIGLAMKVHRELGGGFLERVYENALAVLLRKESLNFDQQYPLKVYFENEIVGEYVADIILDRKIIIELKVAESITSIHKAQAINYLKATKLQLAIILNFGKQSLQHERVVNFQK